MSRIGKQPVSLPETVQVEINGSEVTVSGQKGTLTRTFHPNMEIVKEDGTVIVRRLDDERQNRALHGLTRALLNNMVAGVSEGFTRRLVIEGVGYRAEMQGQNLVLHVGYSHPVTFEPQGQITYAVEDRGKAVVVSGIDKEVVGEIAARIRRTRPPEPYKGKGIRYDGEHIRRKAGKAGKV